MFKIILQWLAAFMIAPLLASAVSEFFINDYHGLTWDDTIEDYIYTPGHIYKHVSEGHGLTVFGKHGINGIPDITKIHGPKIAIWGDSFVEGFCVSDEYKIPQQFTKIWWEKKGEVLTGVGLGMAWRSVADYYVLMENYEKLAGPFLCHVIVFANLGDILPGYKGRKAEFVSKPTYAFSLIENRQVSVYMAPWIPASLRKAAIFFRAFGFPLRDILEYKLRFHLGPSGTAKKDSDFPETPPVEALSFMFSELKQKTDRPIIFLYIPDTPYIEDGSVVFNDPYQNFIKKFEEECEKAGIGFINMQDMFNEMYRKSKVFPHGFQNSHPWYGHINKFGHYLVAKAISDYLEAHPDALYTN